jgi:hypothetical protein
MLCRTLRRPRPRRRHAWLAACGLSLVACLSVATSRSLAGATDGRRFLEDLDATPTRPLDDDLNGPASTNQNAVDPAGDASADDENTKEHVNPVPVTPQLGAAALTFAGLLIVRYRRDAIKWLTA